LFEGIEFSLAQAGQIEFHRLIHGEGHFLVIVETAMAREFVDCLHRLMDLQFNFASVHRQRRKRAQLFFGRM
jgi:hypothetical protein